MKEQKEEHIHISGCRPLLLTWAALLVLTGITVWVAGLELERYAVTLNILIASLKAGLVLFMFMHIKYESAFYKVVLLLIIVTLTAIMALTFLDVLYR